MKRLLLIVLCLAVSKLMLGQAAAQFQLESGVQITGKFQGFSTAGIFNLCPPGNDSCMQWLADLKPQVVRFPSGGEVKFTHLTSGPGYGYDLDEITTFSWDYFDCDEKDVDCGPGSAYQNFIETWELECQSQALLEPSHLYINDFIVMIHNLEAIVGYKIDVLFVLNIITASAEENYDAIKMLVENDIQVVGVEMGNEVYGQSDLFPTFHDFLAYIQNPDGALGDQDYIGMVRKEFPDAKIGVSAALPSTVDIAQGDSVSPVIGPTGKRIEFDNWNIALGNAFDTTRIIYNPEPQVVPMFDAAIVHLYYDERFWFECSETFLMDFDKYGGSCCPYTFDSPDPRLNDAFECFNSNTDFFRDTILKLVDDYYIDRLHLNDPALSDKKMWTTEFNILESDGMPETEVFNNTLVHGSLLFDWQHTAHNLNSSLLSNPGYHQYKTIHNGVGASYKNLVTGKKQIDVIPGDDKFDDVDIRPRMAFHTLYLMRHLTENQLIHIDVTSMVTGMKMYAYADKASQFLYLYYNNVGIDNSTQIFDADEAFNVISDLNDSDCEIEISYPIENEYIRGKQLYSTSGAAYIFDINPNYDADNQPELEIDGSIYETIEEGDELNFYKNSLGVLKIPLVVNCEDDRLASGQEATTEPTALVYPNPGVDYVNIDVSKIENYANGYTIQIFDFTGKGVELMNSDKYIYKIYRNKLSTGLYQYKITFADGKTTTGSFIFK